MKCLIIDPMHESLFPMLQEIGWEADYQPAITRDEIKKIHYQYQGLIVRSKTRIDRDLLGDEPVVKFVARAGAGVDNLELDYLLEKKIKVLHAAEGNRDAVGEHTVGLLLALIRNIAKADHQVRSFIWQREENRGWEIMDKTVGIIGYGNMGRSFARRLSGFGCKVLAYDNGKSQYSDSFCEEGSMEQIYNTADILSLHVPLTNETRNMVNREYLSRFKKDILFINTSRGEIVVQKDLVEFVESGKVKGAALDVLENEKLKLLTVDELAVFNRLSKNDNVLFTPHIAGWTVESHVKINVVLVNKIKMLNL